ncbi:DUF7315 family membrane protein [Halobaculum halobium]|uniref:DUF7315 domain-containing protein n=1 Tax=Halobaculum halobium TaxID=3032281 RepID=A0ABD5TGE5_9EURY|nr:hypothetical protein [Halobaculum sp. SYNS20]
MSETPGERDTAAASDDGPPGTTASAEGPTAGGDASEPDGPVASGEGRARDVVVPLALYKRVTAYATLAAVVTVVLGFVMLDAATLQVSLTRRFVVGVLGAVGIVPPETLLTALFSLAGLGLIAFGAGVYVLGSRFRAAGMTAENGNSQDDDGEV